MRSVGKVVNKYAGWIMLLMGILFYFVPGEWISIEDDSIAYLEPWGREGVLPGYPAFLQAFRKLLGEQFFLDGVVIAQSILAILCTFLFVLVLKKQFELYGGECVLLYLACMLPFSIYLPQSGITHQIMTEGITYAIFYLFFIAVLKAVWTLRFRWYFACLAIAFLLGLTRSQMLLLQVVCLGIFIWITAKRCKRKTWSSILCTFVAFIMGIILAFSSYKSIYAVVAIYYNQEFGNEKEDKSESMGEEEKSSTDEIVADVSKKAESEDVSADRPVTSQFDSVLLSRGFYEADREDVMLFEDEVMQEIFLRAYEKVDEGKHLYIYAGDGLYMWRNLVYDRMTSDIHEAIEEYDCDNPGMRTQSEVSIVRELGMRILIKHFDRYLYHTFRLMLPSLISTVFFQIEPIYLLCHIITFLIYLSAIWGAAYLIKFGGNSQIGIFMFSSLVIMMVMVILTNLVFIGLQRYMVYGMGIFYCAAYLVVRELVMLKRQKMRSR